MDEFVFKFDDGRIKFGYIDKKDVRKAESLIKKQKEKSVVDGNDENIVILKDPDKHMATKMD